MIRLNKLNKKMSKRNLVRIARACAIVYSCAFICGGFLYYASESCAPGETFCGLTKGYHAVTAHNCLYNNDTGAMQVLLYDKHGVNSCNLTDGPYTNSIVADTACQIKWLTRNEHTVNSSCYIVKYAYYRRYLMYLLVAIGLLALLLYGLLYVEITYGKYNNNYII